MAVPAIGDLFLMTMKGKLFQQTIINTFWWNVDALNIANTPTVETLCNQTFTAMGPGTGWTTNYLAMMPSNYTLQQMWMQKIFPTRIMKEVLQIDLDGTHAQEAQTANLQGSIMRRTEVAAAGNIGGVRIVLPGGATVQLDGLLTGAYKTIMGAFAANMDSLWTLAAGTVLNPVLPTRLPPVPPKKQGVIDGSRDQDRVEVMPEVRGLDRRVVGRGE